MSVSFDCPRPGRAGDTDGPRSSAHVTGKVGSAAGGPFLAARLRSPERLATAGPRVTFGRGIENAPREGAGTGMFSSRRRLRTEGHPGARSMIIPLTGARP